MRLNLPTGPWLKVGDGNGGGGGGHRQLWQGPLKGQKTVLKSGRQEFHKRSLLNIQLSLLQKCPLKSSCNCIWRKRGTREIRGGGGEGGFKFPTKTEDGGEEAEEKERKRAIEGSGVSGRASERGCSSGASPPTVRDLHRLSFISACPSWPHRPRGQLHVPFPLCSLFYTCTHTQPGSSCKKKKEKGRGRGPNGRKSRLMRRTNEKGEEWRKECFSPPLVWNRSGAGRWAEGEDTWSMVCGQCCRCFTPRIQDSAVRVFKSIAVTFGQHLLHCLEASHFH